jgi:hypothetical protein
MRLPARRGKPSVVRTGSPDRREHRIVDSIG